MKKLFKIISAVLTLLTVCSLIGCDTGNGRDTTTEAQTTAEQITDTVTETETEPVVTEPVSQFIVTEENGRATVSDGGFKYVASGYEKLENETFVIKNDFTAEFDDISGKFNRMIFSYTCTEPVKLHVKYISNSSEKTDTFYVEAAECGTFGCLISSYVNAGVADKLLSVTAETCTGKTAEFMIYGVQIQEAELINKTTNYLENDRFKVGINLLWGGGINYVEDKKDGQSSLKNLVNSHDTGRLIQQSYYGTAGNDEYQPGTFMNNRWVYNPVQGGDQFGNSSRLIDFNVTETSVYIKSQPQDWSNNNFLTPSYMENTYTVTDEYIRVDNRFVDFSGWEHRYASQELPALYTISYLSRFTWYDGTSSWQDDTLSYRDNLNFWGDAKYVNDCSFKMKTSNTETWCAWTNPDIDYGLGIYVPNVDELKAGRYNFNNSKKSSDDATNYVAPLNTIKMIAYKPIEYSYIMTTGTISQIRATFKKYKDFSDNASLHNDYISTRVYDGDLLNAVFDNAESVAMMTAPNNSEISYSSEQKAAVIKCIGADPHISFDYTSGKYAAEDYGTLTIEYMIPTDNAQKSYCFDLFPCAGSTTAPDGGKRLRYDLTADGEYHTLEVKLAGNAFWKGTINLLRFDYFDNCAVGDIMYLRSFKLS